MSKVIVRVLTSRFVTYNPFNSKKYSNFCPGDDVMSIKRSILTFRNVKHKTFSEFGNSKLEISSSVSIKFQSMVNTESEEGNMNFKKVG